MRSLILTAFLASALLPLAGCNLYFSGGDDAPPCDEWGGGSGGGAQPAPELLRNPQSGECEEWGWGGTDPWPCDSECGPCAGTTGTGSGSTEPVPVPPTDDEPTDSESDAALEERAPQEPPPTWGYCDSYCTGLDETGCLATDGCRGIYDQAEQFQECWQTDFSDFGVVECEGLDAQTCSTSDACIAVHEFVCGDGGTDPGGADPIDPDGFQRPECGAGWFLSCHNEGSQPDGCYGDEECGDGFSCNAAELCLPPPGGSGNGDASVPAVCYGYCEPDNTDPGECDGEVLCDSLPPLCEAGTTPGIAEGCWTGHCIDLDLCPAAECGEILGESMCIAREDCSAYYVGDDCSCDANGCTCAEWLFDSCAQADGPMP